MENKEELLKKRSNLQKQLEELDKKIQRIDSKVNFPEFTEVEFKGKLFRICIWEKRPVDKLVDENFICKIDRNFRLAEFQEFNELLENRRFSLEKERKYLTKHFNKLQQKENHLLSGFFLSGVSGLDAWKVHLSISGSYGRVVLVKSL